MAKELAGLARLMLPEGVGLLDPSAAVFEAMLEGWAAQLRTRFLTVETVRGRVDLVRRFAVLAAYAYADSVQCCVAGFAARRVATGL
jgi:hypothetical protein